LTVFLIILGILTVLILTISFICFMVAFFVTKKEVIREDEYPLPVGEIYEPWRDIMINWMKQTRALPYRDCQIRSFDGLLLKGKFYEYAPGAPIELMMHGYRGAADRDLCGGVQRCFKLGRSALVVDQRACSGSEGRVITFGIRESRDCISWVDYIINTFGADIKIILTGISMGASTVLMAAGQDLPDNVIGVLADCGYTSAKEIIQKVIQTLKLPPKLSYPFVKLGALLFGGFNPDADSAVAAAARCKVPVIFYHGESDEFVPCSMSKSNYDACTCKKALVTIPGAGHGLCYPVDHVRYLETLKDFFGPEASAPAETANTYSNT